MSDDGKQPEYIIFNRQDIVIDLPLVIEGHRNAPAKQARLTRKNKRNL